MKESVDIQRSMLAVVRNSVGTNMFRNLYATVNGETTDVIRDGELACAFYVSSVLALFNLLDGVHTTVDGTEHAAETAGWTSLDAPRPGCLLLWTAVQFPDGEQHRHIGFYVGKDRAVSTSAEKRTPQEHHWQFNGERTVERLLWHPALESAAEK